MLGALTGSKLRDAIVRPADAVVLFFEKGLVGTIANDVEASPGALPLLQHALLELWVERRGPWLTTDAYDRTGGVIGALSRRARAVHDALPSVQQQVARQIYVRLTTLGDGVPDTRRRASRSELYPAGADRDDIDAVLLALSGEQARLIVIEEESVELAHEALLRSWDTLRQWLEEDRGSSPYSSPTEPRRPMNGPTNSNMTPQPYIAGPASLPLGNTRLDTPTI